MGRHPAARAAGPALLLLALLLPVAGAAEEVPASTAPESARASYPDLKIIGFTDLSFHVSDQAGLRSNSGFSEGQFVLHFTSALSPRVTFFGEVSLTARPEAATGSGPGFNAEVERSILKYTRSDLLKLSVGRYHTPISYWNVAFHHGQWLQTTVSRPAMIEFGTPFLPVHFVGALAEGAIPSGSVNLGYQAGLGNGRSTAVHRGGDAGDVNNHRALIAGLIAQPDRPFGLQVGGAVYLDKISHGGGDHRERILSAHAAFTKEAPEVIFEYAHIRHRDTAGGPAFTSRGCYLQVAYRLKAPLSRWKAYARWEDVRVAEGDPVYAMYRGRRGVQAGVRFDPADLVALKAEYRRQRLSGDDEADNALHTQVSFSF